LLVTGSLSADGSGLGNGGVIVLASNSSNTFVISPSATNIVNGVEGNVTATVAATITRFIIIATILGKYW